MVDVTVLVSAKYFTCSKLDQATNAIVSMSVTQVTEAGNSNNMEKLRFIKTLNNLKQKKVQIKQINKYIQNISVSNKKVLCSNLTLGIFARTYAKT